MQAEAALRAAEEEAALSRERLAMEAEETAMQTLMLEMVSCETACPLFPIIPRVLI